MVYVGGWRQAGNLFAEFIDNGGFEEAAPKGMTGDCVWRTDRLGKTSQAGITDVSLRLA